MHGIWVFLYILSTLKNKSEGNTHQHHVKHMNEFRLACVTINIDTNHPYLVVISCTLVAVVAIKIQNIFHYLKIMF